METESNKQKIELGDLKKCGEITTLLSVGKKEFFLNCGFCDYTFLRLENFISHMCEDHMFHFIGPKKEKTDLPLDLNEENEDADFNMQSSYTVEEIDDSASNLRDFERVEIELDDTKMSDSMDVKDLFGDRFMSEESEESSDDDDLENSDDAEMPEKVLNPNDDAEIADSLKALDVENKFDKKMVLRIFKSFEKRPALWDVDVTLTKHSREKEIKSIAMEVGTPAEWDSVRKLLGKLSSRLRTEMVRKKIYESKGKAYTPIWYSDLNTFLKPRRPSGRKKMSQQQPLLPSSPFTVATPLQEHKGDKVHLTPLLNWTQNISKNSGAPNETAVNLLTEVASLKQKMDEEGTKNEERHRELMKQNEMLYQQVMKQELLIKRIAAQCFPDSVDYKIIPFESIEAIKDVEANLENYSKGEFLEYLKMHLGRDEIAKCIPILFTKKLLLDINWDGKKQKIALKQFKFFHTYVFEAIRKKDMSFPDFETEMRKGFKIAKNKIYKNAAKNKEKSQTSVE
ncbi:PREDICTED: uncharacterized protein LOC108370514 isoform X3 [Rhagoletis zephyria]|uniref:uncharacterized protein LOC108370514 isoform X3 n=1 Tax=Rhagoletis zephyria TaxID=28612 RepID=UPI00081180DF|nr:PREDICTED: uncharacterized protein LOC108370514 isoform X3 [Rhagoletis zephyria]